MSLAEELESWTPRHAAGPDVVLSVNQARLMAEALGLGASGWRRISRAWEYAMANGVSVDAEHLAPPGASRFDSPKDRADYAALAKLEKGG